MRNTIGWASGVTFLAGIWLVISAFVFGAFGGDGGGSWNSLIVGGVIALIAAWRTGFAYDEPGLSWVNAALGAWMIASPFVLDYTANGGRTWNSIIAGFIIVIFASESASAISPGGWTYTTRSAYDPQAAPWPLPYGPGVYAPGAWRPYGVEQGWRREDIGQYRGRGPRGWRRTDAQIRDAVAARMADHPDLDATDIELEVHDGVVKLGGAVPSRQAKRLAEDVAESVGGVHDVQNEIAVRSDRAPEIRRAA